MFVSYTDASVKEDKTFLSFVIFFENSSVIRRKIVIQERNSNIAEALAISELLSFLRYYNFKHGLLLIDCNGVKKVMKRKKGKLHHFIPRHIRPTLQGLNVRSQLIPRELNIAHNVCSRDKYQRSSQISTISRGDITKYGKRSDYYVQLSVYAEYKQVVKEFSLTFHEVFRQLNKLLRKAKLVNEKDDTKLFEVSNMRITLNKDTMVKVSVMKGDENTNNS